MLTAPVRARPSPTLAPRLIHDCDLWGWLEAARGGGRPNSNPLVVSGKAGYGKSALLATFVRRFRLSIVPQQTTVVYRVAGLSKVRTERRQHEFKQRRGCRTRRCPP